ncbi:MAG TPA: ClpXP protease specificity-enhancing factor SspB [Sandaracinaceae bacterium]
MYYRIHVAQGDALPPKKDVARALLLRGSVFVYLDPRRERVRVPPWLANQAQLVLQVGLDLPVPIPDLRVDDTGVYGTLSFNRSPFHCSVPWEAVYALAGDDGMGFVWQDDMPDEIAAEVEQAQRRDRDRQATAAPERRPRLRAIEGGGTPASAGPAAEEQDGQPKPRPPHLRRIK